MKRPFKLIRILTAIIISASLVCGCSNPVKQSNATDKPAFDVKNLEPAKISFCFMLYSEGSQPFNINAINEMLAELNKKTIKEINTEISFKWLPYTNYETEMAKLLESGSGPDAFSTWGYEGFVKKGLLKDLSNLLPELAPNYYSEISETRKDEFEYSKVDGKLYTIPSNWVNLPRDFIIAREDLVKKYAPEGLSTFEDYKEFMQQVKLYEKDITPALIDPYAFFEAYLKGNGYYPSIASMYSKWDAKDMAPIPAEDIPEFNDAYKYYKDGVEKGLIINYKDPSFNALISSGRLGSMLQNGANLHSIFSVPPGFNYSTYTLYPDKLYQTNLSSESVVLNANSVNAERVLLFIEWLESNQENYDLFMYGIKDKQYSLIGNKLNPCNNGNDYIFDWSGCNGFRNYMHERPYYFEPENYKEFLEKNIKDNNENYIKTFEKYGYNISKYLKMNSADRAVLDEEQNMMNNLSNERSKVYSDYMEQIRNGDFSKTLSAYMAEAGGKDKSNKLINFYIAYLNKFK